MSAAPPCPDHPVDNGYPHVPIGTILEEIRKQNTGRRHVVILGAGMSGLVAAYELLKLGNTVEIIEASSGAGEHCSTDQGWIQGALIASLRAVLQIVSTKP